MDPDDDSGLADKVTKGLPQVPSGGWGPVGRIEQAGKVAAGLRRKRAGWQKIVFRGGLVFLGAVALAVLLVALLVDAG